METIIRCANENDIERLETFLEKASLSPAGVRDAIDYFLIMENNHNEMIATLGIEPLGRIGLLRSLAISKELGEKGLYMLFEQILILAKDRELDTLYLASNKRNALNLFNLMGFIKEERENLPEELYASEHVNHILSVDNSFFLKFDL